MTRNVGESPLCITAVWNAPFLTLILFLDGLYASVFSKDIRKALRVARALEAGSVAVNVASPYGAYELPFGGFKGSGIGRQKGSNAVDAWLQEKAIFIQHNW